MPTMMMKCPKTGRPVSTGHSDNTKSLAAISAEGNKSRCSACGGTHMWNKADAWVAEEAPLSFERRTAKKKGPSA